MNIDLSINASYETNSIVSFLSDTFKKQQIKNVVIGLSGGVDSATSLYLLTKVLPTKNIYPVYLPYFTRDISINRLIEQKHLDNISEIPIKTAVDKLLKIFKIHDKIRIGNLLARIRMTVLFDLAKKYNALVCGTENKSEHYLGYFTRFGDEASDIEPIRHLYKTQIYQLAKYLGVPDVFIKKAPTAGLWENQTDEGEFGFSYEEADQVLYLYKDKKYPVNKIEKLGFKNAKKIIKRVLQNEYKHHVPYRLQ